MKSIDERVLSDYNNGVERNRLRADLGLIEFERTKELLLENLPKPPAIIYDIGGAYGEYSWWLASLGYDVHLFDLSPKNIEMSAELSKEYPNVSLRAAEVSDARSINRPSNSADAILLMGPLYHIVDKDERIACLNESKRLLKRGGKLFTAAKRTLSSASAKATLAQLANLAKLPACWAWLAAPAKAAAQAALPAR